MRVAETSKANWQAYAIFSLLGVVSVTVIGVISGFWVLTAIPVGFLFGFFLKKGDLCGSSAFSETFMMRDASKMIGLWILIVVAMLGFGALDLLGWVKLSPKPFTYLSYIVGGVVFGIGMVFAGGCISGCLYKGASGNLNSIIALLGIPVGVMMVEYGPLYGMHVWMKKFTVTLADGRAVSLHGLTGLPFWALALLFGVLTVVGSWFLKRKLRSSPRLDIKSAGTPWLERALTRSWRPWVAGVAIGLLMVPGYLSSAASGRNYPLGVTHGVMQTGLLLVDHGFKHVTSNKPEAPTVVPTQTDSAPQPKKSGKQIIWWLVLEVAALMVGSWVSARMAGQARLLPKPPDELMFALLGGTLAGIGAAFAGGCVVGNIMSGWALLSVGMFLFGIVTVLSNWATTYFYMMGGQRMR